MTWTAPRTWGPGEDLVAENFNVHIRDNLLAIGGAWTSYTPTFTWTSSSFTFTTAGRYIQAGKLVIFQASALISGGTYGSGTGSPTITLPVTALSTSYHAQINVRIIDSGTAWYQGSSSAVSTSAIYLNYFGTNGILSAPTSTLPFTWTTNDGFFVAGVYEAA